MADKKSSPKKEAPQDQTYAIVEASGKQFWLQPNRYYDLDRCNAEVNDVLTIEKVLLINDGKDLKLGKPYVKDATVEIKVLEHRRGPKIIVYKMRPKKKTRRKNGHRQELTRVLVQSISVGAKTKRTKETKDPKSTTNKVE
ncbi:50S ribosomal protein L21 [Prochlorococcus marinus]|uniref:Large ribosomal subunit protein bL21 n=1 Tax=Prochlorococcus marinus XMU1408 TaxID=2213228 RepID=A0A318QZ06_PROMR|nr:50S ribosomal protein L21 [Prochlorococcus marinus]MBW3042528.1 50S ribosomal protein L21 [Prochlorococcus marinus str. XMU1408]PYE01254.1 50S ribosomal protein L21 [Prochlorococcus marinus XMU1408]